MPLENLGPYKLATLLGRGGMGAVYAARNATTGEEAAVKLLAPHLTDDANFRERFKIEVETLKKLLHPNIVQLFGYGEEAGHLFYAMELVPGRSLQDELNAGRRFNWREVTRIGIDVAKALKHAHDRGVIHRDLKPANLLIDSHDHVKLTDFGIAKLYGGTQITADGGVLGTADYMSPEQAEGKQASSRADLYSLGSVLYTLLAGHPPFAGKTLPEVIHGVRFEKPAAIRRLAPDTPEAFEGIIMQLLEKEPQRRVPTALALVNRLKSMEHALSLDTRIGDPGEEPGVLVAEQPPGDSGQTCSATSVRATAPLPDEPSDREYRVLGGVGATEIAAKKRGVPDFSAMAPAARPQTDLAGEPDDLAEPPAASATHFTTVSEAELRQAGARQAVDDAGWGQLLRSAALLAILVVGVGAIAWYGSRPASADTLYARIQAAAQADDEQRLLDVEGELQQFLEAFPDDARAGELRRYQEDVDLFRLQRRFDIRARRVGAAQSLTHVERAYLEAMQLAAGDPPAGLQKLRAIVALFASDGAKSSPAPENRGTAQCLDLARRQIERLEKSVAASVAEQRATILRKLAQADRLPASDRAAADEIRRAVLALYGDKSWAADLVARAREQIGQPPR
jgi:serine/threonine-protein kinase